MSSSLSRSPGSKAKTNLHCSLGYLRLIECVGTCVSRSCHLRPAKWVAAYPGLEGGNQEDGCMRVDLAGEVYNQRHIKAPTRPLASRAEQL